MWARYSGDLSDTTAGLYLQLSTSDEADRNMPAQLQQFSTEAAGDTDSEMLLTNGSLRHPHHRQQRPANPEDSVTALLDRASMLLREPTITFNSSDQEEATATGSDRDFHRVRAAIYHGHLRAGRSSRRSFVPSGAHPPAPPPPPPPPPPQSQPQDAKSVASYRTRHFFESTFLTSLPVAAAKESTENPEAEVCAPLPPPPAPDSATVGLAERPMCAVFRCSGPDQPLRPPPIVQRTPHCLSCRESYTATCQTDLIDPLFTESVASQTEEAKDLADKIDELDFFEEIEKPQEKPQPLPSPLPELPPPRQLHFSADRRRCKSEGRSSGSVRRDSEAALLPQWQPLKLQGQPPGGTLLASGESVAKAEQQWQKHQGLKKRFERRQRWLLPRQSQLIEVEAAAEQAGVLRTVGRRLNAFFCPRGGCCGTPTVLAAASASAVSVEPSVQSSAARILEAPKSNWQQAETWEARTGAADFWGSRTSTQQRASQSETARSLIGESPSLNAVLNGSSSTEDSASHNSTMRTQRSARAQTARRRRRRHLHRDSNISSRNSSRQRQDDRRSSATSDKKSLTKPAKGAWIKTESRTGDHDCGSEGPGGGGSFDLLLQTLDRAAQKWRLGGPTSTATSTSSPDSIKRCQQPRTPRVEQCRFHTCEVTCELGSPPFTDVEDDAGDSPQRHDVDNGRVKGALQMDGNQSNANGGFYEHLVDLTIRPDQDEPSRGRRAKREPASRRKRHEEKLIGCIAQSLQALSRDLQLCMQTIQGTVIELQHGCDE